MSFSTGNGSQPFVNTETDFFDGFLKDKRRALHRMATDGNVPGAASLQQDLAP